MEGPCKVNISHAGIDGTEVNYIFEFFPRYEVILGRGPDVYNGKKQGEAKEY